MRKTLVALLLVSITAVVFYDYVSRRFAPSGIDFYSFWSVGAAQQFSGYTLGDPYTESGRYIQTYQQLLMKSPDDAALFSSSLYWHGPHWENTATPLPTPFLYTAFGLFPSEFSHALAIYRWGGLIMYLMSMSLLGRMCYGKSEYVVMVGLGLLCTFYPLQHDLIRGNVNSLLLFGLAGLMALSHWGDNRSAQTRVLVCAGIGSGLVLLTVFKPLVLLPCVLLTLPVLTRGSPRERLAMGLGVGLTLVLCLAVSSWFFRSWSVWVHWHEFIQRHLFVETSDGNRALVKLVGEWSGIHPAQISTLLGGLLLGSFLWTLPRNGGARNLLCSDFAFLVSIGIVVTLATAPLVWAHYNVLAVIPAVWLASQSFHRRIFILLVTVAWLMNLEVFKVWLDQHHMLNIKQVLLSVTWVPLWIGILAALKVMPHSSCLGKRNPRAVAPEEIQGGNIAETH